MSNWVSPPRQLELKSSEVQLWSLDLDRFSTQVEVLAGCLSSEELEQAERFVTAPLSNSYIIAHAFLRHILALYLNCSPKTIRFLKNEHGKPYLDPAQHLLSLEFNLSHTRGLALYGVAFKPIGVDVELLGRDMSFAEIAERFFTPAEHHALCALPAHEQQAAFYRCWTLKEAFVKSLGFGLSYGLDQFEVDFTSARTNCLKTVAGSSAEVQSHFVQNVSCAADYVAAFAVNGACESLKFYSANSLDITH